MTGRLLVFALLSGGACATACGDDEAVRFDDAAADAGPGALDAATGVGDERDAPDAHAADGMADAGPFDAAVREVSCESSMCAIALTRAMPRRRYSDQSFCALLHDGTVACWGSNYEGQLGIGSDAVTASANPLRVVGLSNIVSLKGTCAIDKDGSVWCWGYGPYLQSDAAFVTQEWSPVKLPIPEATRLSMVDYDACALVGGEPICWGVNNAGLLPTTAVSMGAAGYPPTAIPMATPANATDVFLIRFAGFLLRDDGTLLSWGRNPGVGRLTSLSPDLNPDPVALEKVTNVSDARQNACAVADGVPYCWGMVTPPPGRPVDLADLDRALPEPVVAPERVVQISNTDEFTNLDVPLPGRWCAVGGSGAVYCWGNNANGQAGDGTTDYATSAVEVPLPAPAVHVETTADSTCALLVDGKVLCWGGNYDGQLGNGKSKVQSLVPVEVLLP